MDAVVDSSGNITSIAAAVLVGSKIIAGTATFDSNGIPTAFPTAATLSMVAIGRGGFSNSLIAAQTLGQINLGAVTTDNFGKPFGLAAHQITSLMAIPGGKRLTLRKVTSQAQVTLAVVKADITLNNLVIRIV